MTDLTPSPTMKAWQQLLVDAGYPMLPYGADGLGGKTTQDALIAYQKANGLTVTGQFDEATRSKLNPKKAIALNPLETMLIETALDAIIPPSPAKEFLMFNFGNIVSIVVGLLPGLPDDVNKIRAAFNDLITDDPAKNNDTAEHLRDAARFARILADEADKVANALDPSGTAQPANQIVNK
jgi:hypothetical protein